jgi:hypothetical protein
MGVVIHVYNSSSSGDREGELGLSLAWAKCKTLSKNKPKQKGLRAWLKW